MRPLRFYIVLKLHCILQLCAANQIMIRNDKLQCLIGYCRKVLQVQLELL